MGSRAQLAAAVSNAGGLGLIGAASAPPEVVREEIRKAKELTDKPFGVNVMLLNPNAEEVAKVVVEEGVKVVTTGSRESGKVHANVERSGRESNSGSCQCGDGEADGTGPRRCGRGRGNGSPADISVRQPL